MATALSRTGEKPLGRTKLSRMFKEAMAAGYMARSEKQAHQNDGLWGAYDYFVGMPDDVATAIQREGVAVLPHARKPHTDDPRAVEPHTVEPHTVEPRAVNQHTNQKVKNLENTDYKKLSPKPSLTEPSSQPQEGVADEELTEFGKHARDQGLTFVFEGSKPYLRWLEFRGADGMPLADVVIIGGAKRRGIWMPALFPPRQSRSDGAAA